MGKKQKMNFGALSKTTEKIEQEQIYASQSVEKAKSKDVGKKPKNSSEQLKTPQKAKKKIGRPTWKNEKTKYVRVSVDVPKKTRDRVKALLYTKLKDDFMCQDHLINNAIEEFLNKHKG